MPLFGLFPEAKEMLSNWAKQNLLLLNKYTAKKYIENEIIPQCLEQYNQEQKNQNYNSVSAKEFLDLLEENKQKYGGDLSDDFPKGMRPLLIIGQDESVFHQFSYSSRSWRAPKGEAHLLPKSNSYSIMVSAFISNAFGFAFCPTDHEINQLNKN